MNKQELIKAVEELPANCRGLRPMIDKWSTLELIKLLDEPQPVKVPQFVADWIEYCKFTHVDLQHALVVGDVYFYNYANQKDFSKLKEFLETENNQAIFARAWLDGYEVEKEKRYFVKVKVTKHYISKDGIGKIFFSLAYKENFTKKRTRRSWLRLGVQL